MNKKSENKGEGLSMEKNSTKSKTTSQFVSLKFSFTFIKKFITMDLLAKASIDELKPTFGDLLGINLFAKRLVYSYNGQDLETKKNLNQLLEDLKIQDLRGTTLNLEVRQEEEGA